MCSLLSSSLLMCTIVCIEGCNWFYCNVAFEEHAKLNFLCAIVFPVTDSISYHLHASQIKSIAIPGTCRLYLPKSYTDIELNSYTNI